MKTLLVSILLIGSSVFAQDTIPANTLDKKHPTNFDQQMLYYYQGELFTGVAVSGIKPNYSSITNYQSGVLHGAYMSFYPDGQIKERTNYVSGRRQGISVMFHKNGGMMMRMKYQEGMPCDTSQSWYANGQQKSWEVITPGQQYVDIATIYYENGNKQYEVRPTYYKQWYENGNLREEGELLNNVKVGKVKYYSENGKLYKTEWYEDGKVVKTKEKKKK